MFVIIHALLGGLIGEYFNSILLIILFSFLSHFFLDMMPHWDGGGFDKKFFNKNRFKDNKRPKKKEASPSKEIS